MTGRCDNPTCLSGRPARSVTTAFRPLTAIADDFANLNYRPEPEVERIATCLAEPCKAWARLRAESIASPWIEDYAKMARRKNPIPPPHIQHKQVARAIDEAIATIERCVAIRGKA